MPTIKLSETECRKNLLPDLCMFCGEPSSERKHKNFAWHPSWVWILILVSALIAVILALVLTKRMTVRVPVCERHRGYWMRRGLVLGLSFTAIAAVSIGVLIFMGQQGPGNDDLTGWLCGGSVVLFFIWLIVAAVYSSNGVRPTEITDRYIKLAGVHQDFVNAIEDDRDRDREEEQEYRRKRRAEREDRDRDRVEDRDRDRIEDRDRDRPRRTQYRDRRRDDEDDLERRARD
jgi:hypothetical protein